MAELEKAFVVVLIAGITGFIIIFGFANWFVFFKRELKYVNMEIRRTGGNQKRYWKRKRCRLWLSLLPFVSYK